MLTPSRPSSLICFLIWSLYYVLSLVLTCPSIPTCSMYSPLRLSSTYLSILMNNLSRKQTCRFCQMENLNSATCFFLSLSLSLLYENWKCIDFKKPACLLSSMPPSIFPLSLSIFRSDADGEDSSILSLACFPFALGIAVTKGDTRRRRQEDYKAIARDCFCCCSPSSGDLPHQSVFFLALSLPFFLRPKPATL